MAVTKVIFLTTASLAQQSWLSPNDFPSSATIEIIGAGGVGAKNILRAGGGGAGARAVGPVIGLAPNTRYNFMLNPGGVGGGTSWFFSSSAVAAANGFNAIGKTGGLGGQASTCSPTTGAFSGGDGGTGGSTSVGCCGGGGAAGPHGPGAPGGSKTLLNNGGTGGGGADGGAPGQDSGTNIAGYGGNNRQGFGGGTPNAPDGIAGGGGVGFTAQGQLPAASSIAEPVYLASDGTTAGPGGGGGGGAFNTPATHAGDGGQYGGGSGGVGTGAGSTSGIAGQALIIITYVVPGTGTITINPHDPNTLVGGFNGVAPWTTGLSATIFDYLVYTPIAADLITQRAAPVVVPVTSASLTSISTAFALSGDRLEVSDVFRQLVLHSSSVTIHDELLPIVGDYLVASAADLSGAWTPSYCVIGQATIASAGVPVFTFSADFVVAVLGDQVQTAAADVGDLKISLTLIGKAVIASTASNLAGVQLAITAPSAVTATSGTIVAQPAAIALGGQMLSRTADLGGISVSISGAASSATTGLAQAQVARSIVGVARSSNAGSVAIRVDDDAALTGQVATATTNDLGPASATVPTGATATSSAGEIASNDAVSISNGFINYVSGTPAADGTSISVPSTDIPPPIPSAGVFKHSRGSTGSRVGWLLTQSFIIGAYLSGSIYVYVPSAWSGTGIHFGAQGANVIQQANVNLALRDQWQQLIIAHGPAVSSQVSMALVANDTTPDEIFYSAAWTVQQQSAVAGTLGLQIASVGSAGVIGAAAYALSVDLPTAYDFAKSIAGARTTQHAGVVSSQLDIAPAITGGAAATATSAAAASPAAAVSGAFASSLSGPLGVSLTPPVVGASLTTGSGLETPSVAGISLGGTASAQAGGAGLPQSTPALGNASAAAAGSVVAGVGHITTIFGKLVLVKAGTAQAGPNVAIIGSASATATSASLTFAFYLPGGSASITTPGATGVEIDAGLVGGVGAIAAGSVTYGVPVITTGGAAIASAGEAVFGRVVLSAAATSGAGDVLGVQSVSITNGIFNYLSGPPLPNDINTVSVSTIIPPPFVGMSVYQHQRMSASLNTVAKILSVGLPANSHVVSYMWVYVPSGWSGTSINSANGSLSSKFASLALRDQWQMLSVGDLVVSGQISLFLKINDVTLGESIYSSGWIVQTQNVATAGAVSTWRYDPQLGASATVTAGGLGIEVDTAVTGAGATTGAGTVSVVTGTVANPLGGRAIATAGTAALGYPGSAGAGFTVAATSAGSVSDIVAPMPLGAISVASSGNLVADPSAAILGVQLTSAAYSGQLIYPNVIGSSVQALAGKTRYAEWIRPAGARAIASTASLSVSNYGFGITNVSIFGSLMQTVAGALQSVIFRSASKGVVLATFAKPLQTLLNWITIMVTQNVSPAPVWLPSMRAGETDGRYVDCTPDLGPTGDKFLTANSVTITITRADGLPMTVNDLQTAGAVWPNVLDATQLIPTFGFMAPLGSAGVTYNLVLTATSTAQGRVFIRDLLMTVVAQLG